MLPVILFSLDSPIPLALELWDATYGPEYRVDAEVVRTSLFEHPSVVPELSSVGGALLVAKRAGPYDPAGAARLHLAGLAFRDAAEGLLLVRELLDRVRARGVEEVVFGRDSGHLLPGCPVGAQAVLEVLRDAGFEESGEVHDLERDLVDYIPPRPSTQRSNLRLLRTEDLAALDAFLATEFPGRWRHDVLAKLRVEADPGFIAGAFDEGRCVGFALLQDWQTTRMPIGGAVRRASLGPRWGALGPIGVARALRGRGLGDTLLAYGLDSLRKRGVRRCVIDWTTLVEFYGRHGFEVARTYRQMTARLRPVDSMLPK